MSVLKLTAFSKLGNDIDLNSYKDYELALKPEVGEDVFIYHKFGDGANNNATDKINFSIVRKYFGYAAKDKFDKMAVQLVKNNSGKNKGAEFINSRTSELSTMYDELTDLFLKYLHKSVWNTYDITKKKFVLSTINFQDAYDDLKMGIDSFELILTKIIEDKFSEKYAEIETVNANKQKDLDLQIRLGKKK